MTQLTLDSLFAQAEAQQDLTIKNLSVLKLRMEDTTTDQPTTVYTVAIWGDNIEKETVAELRQHKQGEGDYDHKWQWRNTKTRTVSYTVRVFRKYATPTTYSSPERHCEEFEVKNGVAPVTVRKQALQWLVDQINNQNNQ